MYQFCIRFFLGYFDFFTKQNTNAMGTLEQLPLKVVRKAYQKLFEYEPGKPRPDYFGTPILADQAGNDWILKRMEDSSPLMIARFGSTELLAVSNYLHIQEMRESNALGKIANTIKGYDGFWRDNVKEQMSSWSGFFPATDEMLDRFGREFLAHTRNVDGLGVWFNKDEDVVFFNYCPLATLFPLVSIEPYYHQNPWTASLRDKKVLVIHPMEESILHQFEKRAHLFQDPNMLPPFHLQTIKAVQSIANNDTGFTSWFDAYEHMCEEMAKKDFDVLIVGAGAYGLPLASYAKQLGKKAIHMAGATQILFGIKGKRWDENPFFANMYNEYWTRPLETEKPKNHQKVENGCYW